MKFLLDASVLVPLLLDYGEKLLDVSVKVSLYTMDLTVYEVGNSLWRLANLLKAIDLEDAVEIMEVLTELTRKSFLGIIRFSELDISRILKLTVIEGLTFYDSSYIVAAEKLNVTLATEDEELGVKARKYVKTITYRRLRETLP